MEWFHLPRGASKMPLGAVTYLSSLLKKGTGSEPSSENAVKYNGREVPVPLFQQAARHRLDVPAGALTDAKKSAPSSLVTEDLPCCRFQRLRWRLLLP